MAARPLVLVATVAVLLSGLGTARAQAATLYGGGSVPRSTAEPVPLFLVAVDRGRVSVLGFSGGACSNGRPGFGRFLSRPTRLRRGGRFRTSGTFAYVIAGGVARGSYRVTGTVRARSGVATGRASVRVRFPAADGGKVNTCKGLNRPFRARNPAAGRTARVRGPFYGVTSQGLPVLIRPAPDSSALVPLEIWTTLNCTVLGATQPVPRLTIPRTTPGVYAKSGNTSGSFVPALGATAAIPLGTYNYSSYNLSAQIANGVARGIATVSSKVGNAQKQLVDTCSAPPITFIAVP